MELIPARNERDTARMFGGGPTGFIIDCELTKRLLATNGVTPEGDGVDDDISRILNSSRELHK